MDFRREKQIYKKGYALIAGADEVGRGAWAGPLVGAAVLVTPDFFNASPKACWIQAVRDSKQLSAHFRDELFDCITASCEWSVGIIDVETIDLLGIGEANRMALRLAVSNLVVSPSYVFTDYIDSLVLNIKMRSIVHGDARIWSVAAASIVAKVFRDRIMAAVHELHPGYGFAAHKGYGTSEHRTALHLLGPCEWHRKSFRPVRS